MKQVYITLQQIKALNPCATALREVRTLFGKRTRLLVTERRAVALAQQFDFYWLGQRTLSDTARKAYDEALAPTRKAYDEAIADAWKARNDAIAPALQAYDEALAPARKAYDEAIAPA